MNERGEEEEDECERRGRGGGIRETRGREGYQW